jgi:hypothetical protein
LRFLTGNQEYLLQDKQIQHQLDTIEKTGEEIYKI